jgi:hypothetical protein
MSAEKIWALEEKLWCGDARQMEAALDPECVMAFPAPVGILAGPPSIRQALEEAPRWSRVALSERDLHRPAPDVLVLAYRTSAQRDEAPPYNAYCTSTYRRRIDGWRLVQHQQTPI